ncbi:MAG: aconitate hydratase, partial [Thermodesulfobacteriota bacterium]
STMEKTLNPEIFRERYSEVFGGDERWRALRVPEGSLYEWDPESTYLREPPFFKDFGLDAPPLEDIKGARMLALLGDSVTTDHISPAGAIPKDGPAGKYLIQRGVSRREFNSFGSRRGNHEVMIRGTFANIRIKNFMASGTEGGWTKLQPDGQVMSIYDAAQAYKERGTPLIVVGGKEYGSGSSRDWAAKGTMLLGVKAVIAESFERIHRSNLVGMGVLPLQFAEGENGGTWKMDGTEEFSIDGIARGLEPKKRLTVLMKRSGGSLEKIEVICRLDSPVEVDYFTNSGILQTVLRDMLRSNGGE